MTPTPPTIGRRNALQSIAAITAIGVTGTGALILASEPARAEVTMNDLAVADQTIRESDGQLEAVWARVGGTYEYVSQDVEPDGVRLDLHVSPDTDPKDWNRIAREEQVAFGFDQTANWEMLGEVTSHAGFDPTDWDAPDAGTTTAVPVRLRVTFAVLDGDAILASATAEDLATLTLENDSVALSLGVEGTGSFDVVANDGDATPTL